MNLTQNPLAGAPTSSSALGARLSERRSPTRQVLQRQPERAGSAIGAPSNPNGIVSLQPRVAESARLPWIHRRTGVTTLKGLHQTARADATPWGVGEFNNDLPRVVAARQPRADGFESRWDSSSALMREVCHCPPSPRPSPPGEGDAIARRGWLSGSRHVAGSLCFRSERDRKTSRARFARNRRTIHPLLGERAGVRIFPTDSSRFEPPNRSADAVVGQASRLSGEASIGCESSASLAVPPDRQDACPTTGFGGRADVITI